MTSSIQKLTAALFFISPLLVFVGCWKPSQKLDVAAYREEITKWQSSRHASITREDGWLTLCGLFWLHEGENSVGGDSSNAIALPTGKTPKKCGSIFLEKGETRFRALRGVGVKLNDSVVTSIKMISDSEGEADPTILKIGTVSFYVIKRGDQVGVRVKDAQNSARVNFKGLEYFPIDPDWRFDAKFLPYTPQKSIKVVSVVGTTEIYPCPGALSFNAQGVDYRIDAVLEPGTTDRLFIMFTDETSGKETYKMGRQLYSNLPDSAGNVVLDFNKAYNWPCVFTDFATCPIPPEQNHLAVRVTAGEKMYSGHE